MIANYNCLTFKFIKFERKPQSVLSFMYSHLTCYLQFRKSQVLYLGGHIPANIKENLLNVQQRATKYFLCLFAENNIFNDYFETKHIMEKIFFNLLNN